MPFIGDLGEVAGELQAHALAWVRQPIFPGVETVEEIGHRHAQHAGDLEESAGGDAVDAALVFVRLLVGDADEIGELLLGQASMIRRSRIRMPT